MVEITCSAVDDDLFVPFARWLTEYFSMTSETNGNHDS